MLKKFTVSNYRGFEKPVTIDFSQVRDYKFNEECVKDGLVNKGVLYGKNAVGKTNLGRAILDIRTMIVNEGSSDRVGFINAKSDKDVARFEYIIKLHDSEIEYVYEKYAENKIRFESLKINQNLLYEFNFATKKGDFSAFQNYRELELLNLEEWDDEVSVLKYILGNTKLNELSILKEFQFFVRRMINIQATGSNTLLSRELLKVKFKNMTSSEDNWVGEFNKFLKKVGVDVNLTIEETLEGEKELYLDYGEKLLKFTDHASSGTISLLGLYLVLQWTKDLSFLYVDEFDANYHFDLAKTMLEEFKKIPECQIIITTHNTDLMSNKYMRPDCYFLMYPNQIISVADATGRELRQGHNLEKLYQAGEFNELVNKIGERDE